MNQLCTGYKNSLNLHNLNSYNKKIKLCFDVDPYEINYTDCDNDWSLFPAIAHGDILHYLVYSTSAITLEQMKAYKSLEAHNYFTSGWVNPTVYHKALEQDMHLLLGEVNHSQSLRKKSLKVWILSNKDGNIVTGNCTCMAGLGGSCSHIGALLFAVETGLRLYAQSCTSVRNKWLLAHIKNVPLTTVKELDFSSAKKKKKCFDNSKHQTNVNNTNNSADEMNMNELQDFLQKIKDTGTNSAILKVVHPFCKDYSTVAPLSLRERFFDEKCFDMPWQALFLHCQKVFKELTVSKADADFIQRSTKGQSKSKYWYYQRAGRVTASVMKKVQSSNIDKPPSALLKEICYPENKRQISSKAIMWGKTNEWKAVQEYKNQQISLHDGLKVESCGLFVNPEFSFIGASPDAVISCKCCGIGVCEIKCPYSLRDINLKEINFLNTPYLEFDEAHNLCLKKDHEYYHQIQTQIFTCNANYADFVVWTNKSLVVERFLPDYEFWETCLEKSGSFFVFCILPELCCKWFTRQDELEQLSEVDATH